LTLFNPHARGERNHNLDLGNTRAPNCGKIASFFGRVRDAMPVKKAGQALSCGSSFSRLATTFSG
ncbi:hypothetical protein, partial [Chelatococcus sp.]|uniref:hypothetical protein n=1 Tax=Chelatococcus sp. TaxID=1953771 RepID=UPI0025BB1909